MRQLTSSPGETRNGITSDARRRSESFSEKPSSNLPSNVLRLWCNGRVDSATKAYSVSGGASCRFAPTATMIQHAILTVVTQVLLRPGCRAAFLTANRVLFSCLGTFCDFIHLSNTALPMPITRSATNSRLTTGCSTHIPIPNPIAAANQLRYLSLFVLGMSAAVASTKSVLPARSDTVEVFPNLWTVRRIESITTAREITAPIRRLHTLT